MLLDHQGSYEPRVDVLGASCPLQTLEFTELIMRHQRHWLAVMDDVFQQRQGAGRDVQVEHFGRRAKIEQAVPRAEI
jgi:hypothetical protein